MADPSLNQDVMQEENNKSKERNLQEKRFH